MPDVMCDWCRDPKNLCSKTPRKMKSKHHFHNNDCRIKYMRKYGFYGNKPNHSMYRRLCAQGDLYLRTHEQNQWNRYRNIE